MSTYNIYIVEDDRCYGEILSCHLGLEPDFKVTHFQTARDCLSKMHLQPDLITLDFSLPDMTGEMLFERIREINPNVPVIVISSQEDIMVAVNMLKSGVSDYLIKDDAIKDLLWNSIIRIRENQLLKRQVEMLKEELGQKYAFGKTIIGQSDSLKKVFSLMDKAIKTKINVSICGETGTGKEVVAKAIHYHSDRKNNNFVAVNMAAIPKELIETELFGHEKGAFTGSVARKTGKFEEANGGTLYLDEIAALDLSLQSKLLRVLQERKLIRVGGNDTIKLDVRFIVATQRNLAAEVKKGNFREDLFFRVMGLPIQLPPLRERSNDILILAKHFMDVTCKENKLSTIVLSNQAKDKLLRYHFPGNIRELKAIVELAAIMCTDHEISADDITLNSEIRDEISLSETKSLRQHNKDIVSFYLKINNNEVKRTAAALEIGVSTIYKMIQQKEIIL